MRTLLGHPYSHNSRKVHWALEELGLDYDYQVVELAEGAHKTASFLELNPNGRVPVLRSGDTTIYESNAILLHLGGALIPEAEGERAAVLQWLLWDASDFMPVIQEPWLLGYYAMLEGRDPPAEAMASLVEEAEAPLGILDAALEGREFLVGAQLSAADIALAESVAIAPDAGVDLAPYRHISSWLEGLSRRPAFARTRPGAGG